MTLAWPLAPRPAANQDLVLVPWSDARNIPNVQADITTTSKDPKMLEFTQVPENYTEDMAESFLADISAVRWALTIDNRYCGNIELRLQSEDSKIVNVGYSVSPWARGQNLAARALALIAAQAFASGVFRIELRAAVQNLASCKVAEKAGFTFEGVARAGEHLRGNIYDLAVYSKLTTD